MGFPTGYFDPNFDDFITIFITLFLITFTLQFYFFLILKFVKSYEHI